MAKFRVAVIGCGRIGTHHVQAYHNDPRADIVALCDIIPTKAADLAKANTLDARIYTDYRELITNEKPDLISVALWTHLHLPVVRDLCAAGVRAVHCEKPVAPTYGDVQEMTRVAGQSNTRLTFNHQRRFAWTYAHAREILHSGAIGGLQRIEVFNPDNILDWGTHMIDLIHMYNREVPAKWVMAQIDARHSKQWFDIPFESQLFGAVRFENGVRATISSGEDKEISQGLRLTASNGIIELINEDIIRTLNYGEGKWLEQKASTDGFVSGFNGMMKHLLDTLETGQQPEVIWHRAVRAAEVIYGMYESARHRARIDLPLTGITDHPFVTMLHQGLLNSPKPTQQTELKPEPAKVTK